MGLQQRKIWKITMKRQKEDEIITFLRNNIEPLEDSIYGRGYRASAYLTDGTFLPCVLFRNSKLIIELAMRRFQEEQKPECRYYDIVKTFVAHGNCINDYDIAKVEKSRYAFPGSVMNQIGGETSMAWTGFAAKMKDGRFVGFGTTFCFEFFDMPDEYSTDDIEEIVNHSYVLETGELRSHKVSSKHPDDYHKAKIFRERPFFECYMDKL